MQRTSTFPLRLPFSNFRTDPRHYQIFFLGSFLTLGVGWLGWHLQLYDYLALFAACLGMQALLITAVGGDWRSLKSAVITALGLCLLLKTNALLTLALGGSFAILSKFALRYKGKHLFNPANFGIVSVLLLTNDAWVSPGQWGSNALLLFLFAAAGLMILRKVGRLETSLVFLLVFGGLSFATEVLYKGWPTDLWLHKMMNGSLLLFAFFMITDPKSIPDHRRARILWAGLIGLAVYLLGTWLYVHTAVVWVLFAASPLTLLFDKLWPAKRFQWQAK